jgi:hypothetical protein
VAGDSGPIRFAERVLRGIGEDGTREEIVIWIERRSGAVWAVGRAIDPRARNASRPRGADYLFEGYELGDAVAAANNALADDAEVSAEEGVADEVRPFTEKELLEPLERWFFGHAPRGR